MHEPYSLRAGTAGNALSQCEQAADKHEVEYQPVVHPDLRSCVKVEVANELYGFCGRKATLNHA